ncbi:MAG TPA: hypothetical protein VFQ61_31880 [Polyangiaceae bacterium]|nr:hypothetical protein [Polyangiaceae bacterium]
MTLALLYGASSGALHAVTGPDHVLSLGPVALKQPRSPWKIGLLWGVGHALGTLALALPLVWWSTVAPLPWLAALGDRLGGVALMLMAGWSWWSLRRPLSSKDADTRRPWLIGLVHGITGATSLLLVLPMLVSGSPSLTLTYLLAFALGSTLAMATLTSALARLGQRLSPPLVTRLQRSLVGVSFAVGALWLARA